MEKPKISHVHLTVHPLSLPILQEIAGKFDAFVRKHDHEDKSASEREQEEYRGVHAAGMPGRAEIDPILTQWMRLSAIACRKLIAASIAYSENHMSTSIDQTPSWGRGHASLVDRANRDLVLSDLNETDLMALQTLEQLSNLKPIPKGWTQYLYPGGRQVEKSVTPSRVTQIDDFEALMAEVRQNRVMQDVFRRVSRLMQRSQGPQR